LLAAPLLALAACGDDVTTGNSETGTGSSTSTTGAPTTTATAGTATATGSSGSDSGSDTADGTTSGTTTTTETSGSTTDETTSTTTTGETTTTTTTTSSTGSTGGICGDGVVDEGEACDEGEANGDGSCCDEACELLAEVVCRAGSGDACDPDELCDGQSPQCPDDVVSEAGTACGEAPDDICLAAPVCSGVSGEACGEPQPDEEALCAIASGCSPELACADVDSCGCPLPALDGPQTVLIIISSDENQGHDMDESWHELLTGLGHDASIVPQSTLNDQTFFATTDVLIVASGVKALGAGQVATIQAFVEAGKGVYLQSEYLATFDANKAFASVVNALGATFAWSGNVTGQLNPVAVSGCLAGHDACLSTLTYHWYAQAGDGSGDGFETFITKGASDIAFSYCPPDPAVGVIVTTTDQDFIRSANINAATKQLMENMFNRVARPQACKP
ncbi:MAG: hypothetical protein KC486_03865, partial [Myxococcales bacterium]|nr:hypothetical protein [Myxococcales bacterium]